jgi:hypothetical protein
VQPGGYHLTLFGDTGHTRVIYSAEPNTNPLHVIRFVSSDVPAEVRVLFEEPFSLKKYLPRGGGGFLRFRWPRQTESGAYELTPEEEMPGFSLGQFADEFKKSYYNTVLKHLGVTNKPHEFLHLRLALVWQKLQARVATVEKGFTICSAEDCSEGTANYENWSTPNRDYQVYELVSDLLQTYWDNYDDSKVQDEYEKWRGLKLDLHDGSGTAADYESLLNVWYNQYYSSDPRAAILTRWGY